MLAATSLMLRRWRMLLTVWVFLVASSLAMADNMTGAQRRAAEEFLAAVASGSPQVLAYALHPAELESLRTRILEMLREEAKRGDSTIRSRLFGRGKPLSDLERLTVIDFYATLAQKAPMAGRRYERVREIAAVPGADGAVHLIVRGVPPKDDGQVQIVELVTVIPYGKDWKAKIPDKVQARIDDLIHGRTALAAGGSRPASGAPAGGVQTLPAPPAIIELLDAAEQSLTAGDCEKYYKEHMSRSFRRVTPKKALESLISACRNNMGTREMLLSTVRIVRGLEPRFEYQGQRAVYDLAGQGLPFDRFVLEQIDKRWYIAE